ncbi:hypothetical protein [Butyricimonas paravirosa]|uniref:Putative ferric reductase n=2 Tax=Butyricimonas paravirosa TaxID=1472417 RepID=A0A7X5YF66_9BACT|nr:hypothetical protein [Butyricimonas paravirosa]NJC19776.1 putative ferric reductase [Butyricimonas paravirosa]WOF13726.1 hypothetical protein F1644_16295 [Butyricimonas paravirosa]GGJ71559.1 hypothetical protein GCM10007042_33230 [Butyricimonas paravirosa]
MITIEIRWKVSDKTPIELTKSFFKCNEWAPMKNKDNNGVFSFGCADNKYVDIHIDDRNGKNAYWAEKLIDALKKENDIASIHLISDTELMDMVEKELIEIDEERTLKSDPRRYIYIIK